MEGVISRTSAVPHAAFYDGGLIESEEDHAEEGSGLLVGIGLEVRMGIDDEGGTGGRGQTSLQEQVRWPTRADDRW